MRPAEVLYVLDVVQRMWSDADIALRDCQCIAYVCGMEGAWTWTRKGPACPEVVALIQHDDADTITLGDGLHVQASYRARSTVEVFDNWSSRDGVLWLAIGAWCVRQGGDVLELARSSDLLWTLTGDAEVDGSMAESARARAMMVWRFDEVLQ